ncbi:MAG: glycyl-radical enzyme activating protein [Thermodesulfobacteriota bacterium]|nr:glycyl-radical enzyme activating protein [Thermodesulfobacteriota bacterium]
MEKQPLILEIKGNSLDDGPGIRSMVFFKGCPLSCVWCHNPESKRIAQEISFDAKECVGCNTCIDTCPNGALSRDNRYFIDRDRCTLCMACVDACPSGALTRVGESMGVDEIVDKCLRDKPFFDTSGGGVTLSGGEPTMYMGFTHELLKRLKEQGVSTLVETCGQFNTGEFEELILPYTDLIYMDIKILDPKEHKRYCGVDNHLILENFIRLNELSKGGGFSILPRVPLIPGITDTEANIRAIAKFLKNHGVKRSALLSYNPLWHEKNDKIGVENPFEDNDSMHKWLPAQKVNDCGEIFRQAGIEI